ncbi:NAD-dependent epimerase/dehydratase family protein [Virgibacillus sp. 179-BFC.A HS]|uniref:NAD-dependent epimerase/dehydratase family protein n=1 Tax=Tigheibacillus jepli TaxID=3035914 RepID=A0ABU5CFC9_9BACI|nr:NAD-dependent epimerase/dehydratase family protein [Virgibacillus sp. 179-BFC.A HS]MDY0405030.1 NAD-dependent epimerase/dehydratase family protein [Virgibacillus sp. 179-BFC.A HS]
MKVLVTGGAGFIGLHCVRKFLEENLEVVIVDNLSSSSQACIPDEVIFYNISMETPDLKMIFAKEQPDYVVHLAAQISVKKSLEDPLRDCLSNINGTLNVLQNCIHFHIKKIIFASSAAVYGEPGYLPIDEAHPQNPLSFYALSKQTAEKYIQLFSDHFDLDYCILRFSNVYGPGQNAHGEAGVISIFLNQLLQQKNPILFGGEQTRDFIYVQDVANAVSLALHAKKNGTFNISTNSETKIIELLDQLQHALNSSNSPVHRPLREGDIIHSRLDNTLAMKELNWKANHSLKQGLLETIRFSTKANAR